MRILVWITMLLVFMLKAALGEEALNIGTRLELFIDDYLIEQMKGVSFELHHPIPQGTVFTFDAPWEGDTSAYVTIFRDGDKYKMYYRGSNGENGHPEVACVAESTDGIHWERPKLGIYEFNGSKDNNIVWFSKGSHAFVPFKDTNPTAKPDQLYKAVAPGSGDGRSVLYAFVSQDGYRWKPLSDKAIITDGAFDSQNVAFWDANLKKYVCYYRDFRNQVRDIKRATSDDFIHWTAGEWLDWGEAPAEHLYTNAIIPYPYAPHIYVGFPKRFVPNRKAIESHPIMGVSDGVFISSRDRLKFKRWREAFMRPGLDQANWTDRNVMAAWGILELKSGELTIYYSQHYRHATNGLMRATIRKDGFVSLHADANGGEMLTKAIIFSGKELVINYSTSAIGEIKVEIQDKDGKPIPGFAMEDCQTIYGDEIMRVVSWKGKKDVSHLAGKPVRLRFKLMDADLYSICFR